MDGWMEVKMTSLLLLQDRTGEVQHTEAHMASDTCPLEGRSVGIEVHDIVLEDNDDGFIH